jgi:hypothetical protein
LAFTTFVAAFVGVIGASTGGSMLSVPDSRFEVVMKIERKTAFDHPAGAVHHALALDAALTFGFEPVDADFWSIDWDGDVPPYPVFCGDVARARATLIERAVRLYRTCTR